MLKIDKKYFWDVDLDSLNLERHKRFIISRILQRGNWPDFTGLITYYGLDRVKEEMVQIRYLDKKTLNFCSIYFNMPLEKFRCYRNKSLCPF